MARLVTLHDADGEIIYPQSVWDENMIPDDTITDNMIDFTQFEAFDIVANDGTLSVTKPYPFKICVMGITSTWGYGGGTVTTSINNASGGATLMKSCPGKGTSGDTIGRNVNCSAIYTCSANTEYTFNIYVQSGGGQSGNQAVVIGFIVRTGN